MQYTKKKINGAYCNYIFIHIEQKHSTSITDTTAFINKIEFVQLSTDALLITYNVMYANMDFEELLNAFELAYTNADKNNLVIPHLDIGDLIFLLRCVLENEFDGKY